MILGLTIFCFLGGAFLAWIGLRKHIRRLAQNLEDSQRVIENLHQLKPDWEHGGVTVDLHDSLLGGSEAKTSAEALQVRRNISPTLSWLLRESCLQLDTMKSRSVNFRVSGIEREWDLNEDTKLAMYRVVLEAVQNAIAHADAKHIHVGVDWWPEGLEIMIQDDGSGITNSHKKEGFRMSRLTSVVRRLGASVWYEDNKPKGTRVKMKLPAPKRRGGKKVLKQF